MHADEAAIKQAVLLRVGHQQSGASMTPSPGAAGSAQSRAVAAAAAEAGAQTCAAPEMGATAGNTTTEPAPMPLRKSKKTERGGRLSKRGLFLGPDMSVASPQGGETLFA